MVSTLNVNVCCRFLDLESNPITNQGDELLGEVTKSIYRNGGGLQVMNLDWCFGNVSSGAGFANEQLSSIQVATHTLVIDSIIDSLILCILYGNNCLISLGNYFVYRTFWTR